MAKEETKAKMETKETLSATQSLFGYATSKLCNLTAITKRESRILDGATCYGPFPMGARSTFVWSKLKSYGGAFLWETTQKFGCFGRGDVLESESKTTNAEWPTREIVE